MCVCDDNEKGRLGTILAAPPGYGRATEGQNNSACEHAGLSMRAGAGWFYVVMGCAGCGTVPWVGCSLCFLLLQAQHAALMLRAGLLSHHYLKALLPDAPSRILSANAQKREAGPMSLRMARMTQLSSDKF